MAVLFKLENGGELRRGRFSYDAEADAFPALLTAVRDLAGLAADAQVTGLTYVDDENDVIALKTSGDLREALALNLPLLRLSLTADKMTPAASNTGGSPFARGWRGSLPQQQWRTLRPSLPKEVIDRVKGVPRGPERRQAKVEAVAAAQNNTVPLENQGASGSRPAAVNAGFDPDRRPFRGGNKNLVRFVAHGLVPEGAEVPCGAAVEKTWVVRNDGPKAWPKGSKLVFLGGSQDPDFGAKESSEIPETLEENSVAPGREVTLRLALRVPDKPGLYESFWRVQGPKGCKWGQRLKVSLVATSAEVDKINTDAKTHEAFSDSDLVVV